MSGVWSAAVTAPGLLKLCRTTSGAVAMPRRRVAVLVESSRSYGRGLLHGLAEYARVNDGWSVTLDDRGLGDQVPGWLGAWRGEGVVARLESEALVAAVRELGVPVVDLRGLFRDAGLPLVETEEPRVVRLAFEHLLGRGARRFAFCGFEGTNYSDVRSRLFAELTAPHGGCLAYRPPARPRGRRGTSRTGWPRCPSRSGSWRATTSAGDR